MPQETLKLSVMDTQWPGHLPSLIPLLDQLGYTRYWATEHHDAPQQSASPTLVTALAGGLSKRMRVGTAGISLSLYSPFKVAEDFRLLELFFSGRLDLGVIRGIPGGTVGEALLDGRPLPDEESYAAQVKELARLVRQEPASDSDLDGDCVGPHGTSIPQLWACGLSPRSATLAASLGLSFAFHHYLHQFMLGRLDGRAPVEAYREAFKPHADLDAPRFNVGCYGFCATSEHEAWKQWNAFFGYPPAGSTHASRGRPVPSFIGTPEQCKEQLIEIQAFYEAPELVIQSLSNDFSRVLDSYYLLAEAFALPEQAEETAVL